MEKRNGAGFVKYRPLFFTLFGRRFGFEHSRVGVGTTPYLDRYILYLGGPTLRLHRFWRGDDDRAPHDHPWDFWTFPFTSYNERVPVAETYDGKHFMGLRTVERFRWHRRDAEFQHIVAGRADGKTTPFWTLVVSGAVRNSWGFWPTPSQFVPWRDWS